MIERVVSAIVDISVRLRWASILLGLALTAGAIFYVVNHFAITTDTSELISSDLDWRQRERQFDAAFPQHTDTIDIVIDGKTPELTEAAAASLAAALSESKPDPFQIVRRRDGGPFFEKNGLLYLSLPELKETTEGLIKAQPVLGTLAADPTLNGLAKALSFVPLGVKDDRAKWSDFDKPLGALANAIDDLMAGRETAFSWGQLLTGGRPNPPNSAASSR